MKVVGYFTLACLLNSGAETTGFDHMLLWNSFPSSESYCLIQDGLDYFGAVSAFLPGARRIAGRDSSFNENEFINCDFRHSGGGIPVWLGDTARHRFSRCYAAGSGDAAFVIYSGKNSHTMLDIDCHCETKGLKSAFRFTGTNADPVIQGFSYIDHQCFAARSIFSRAPEIRIVALHDADIRVAGYFDPACKVFDDPRRWTVTGRYSSRNGSQWNGGASFTGQLLLGHQVSFSGSVGQTVPSGDTGQRPRALRHADEGRLFRDRTLNKIIVWSGSEWVDAQGHKV